MTVVIDAERRTIRAGVSDLLGEPEQRSIGLTGSGLSRLWIGSELHRRIQRDLEVTDQHWSLRGNESYPQARQRPLRINYQGLREASL